MSGFRAYTPTQYTARSNHNEGRALDFRIRGVTNEELRDFCLTLRNAGCGYYPNSTFVHVDARDTKAYWVDFSHPGEPPQYEKASAAADHGTSDVPTDELSRAAGRRPALTSPWPPARPGSTPRSGSPSGAEARRSRRERIRRSATAGGWRSRRDR